jgi:hypothetical protein
LIALDSRLLLVLRGARAERPKAPRPARTSAWKLHVLDGHQGGLVGIARVQRGDETARFRQNLILEVVVDARDADDAMQNGDLGARFSGVRGTRPD